MVILVTLKSLETGNSGKGYPFSHVYVTGNFCNLGNFDNLKKENKDTHVTGNFGNLGNFGIINIWW